VTEPVNVGDTPTDRRWDDGRTSDEMFGNLKAEIWWLARMAFQRTYQHVLFLEGKEGGKQQSSTDVIALPSGDPESDTLCSQLSLVRWFKNEKGKIVIEKKGLPARSRGVQPSSRPRLHQLLSPDYAEAFMLTFVDRPSATAGTTSEMRAALQPDAPDHIVAPHGRSPRPPDQHHVGQGHDRRPLRVYVALRVRAHRSEQAEAAYRSSWLVRKIIDIPPFDMTREWRDWQADAHRTSKARGRRAPAADQGQVPAGAGAGAAVRRRRADPRHQGHRPDAAAEPERVGKGGLTYVHVMSRTS
jgi:hypothetical protein